MTSPRRSRIGLATLALLLPFLFLPATAHASALDTLAASYDYDFSDGTINVTGISDAMEDTDGDGLDDMLVITLMTDARTPGQYYGIVRIAGPAGVVANHTLAALNAGSPALNVTLRTTALDGETQSYAIELRRQDMGLAYRAHDMQTAAYSQYLRGPTLAAVDDMSLGDDALRIALTLEVEENSTHDTDVTVWLAYGNRTIEATTSASLVSPLTVVHVDIGAQAIARTHHEGPFTLTRVLVGEKMLAPNATTQAYSFTQFAHSSYIRGVTHELVEDPETGLASALRYLVALDIASGGTYALSADLADPAGGTFATLRETYALSPGIQTVAMDAQGPELYRTYKSGEFSLVSLTLSGAADDALPDPHVAELSFAQFTPPPRPDLEVSASRRRAGAGEGGAGNDTIIVEATVANRGEAAAYNVMVEAFGAKNYVERAVIPMLAPSAAATLSFLAHPARLEDQLIVIVDPDDQIDEADESDNVAGTDEAHMRVSLSDLAPDRKTKVVEAQLSNAGTVALEGVAWSLSLGDGASIGGNGSLPVEGGITVLAEHAFAASGAYLAIANASHAQASGGASLLLKASDVRVEDAFHAGEGLVRVVGFSVRNAADGARSVEWHIDMDDEIVEGGSQTTLLPGESATYLVEHAYEAPGAYALAIGANASGDADEAQLTLEVLEIEVGTPTLLRANGPIATIEVPVQELFGAARSAMWSLDMGDGAAVSGQSPLQLAPSAGATILVEHAYALPGTRTVAASVQTGAGTYESVADVTT